MKILHKNQKGPLHISRSSNRGSEYSTQKFPAPVTHFSPDNIEHIFLSCFKFFREKLEAEIRTSGFYLKTYK